MDTNSVAGPLQWKGRVETYIDNHGPALFGAILILVGGFFVARWAGRLAARWLARKELGLEPPVQMLLVRLIRLFVVLFALVIAAGTAGVDVTAMVAGIGVAGVGVGLAMQGVLSNIVAGLTIIFTKPFRVGEYIEILHEEGQVTTIELFSTTLLHADRSRVVIPNRKIVGEILHNYGAIRQLNMNVGVAYGTDLGQALAVITDVLKANSRVLKDPAPGVGIAALADSSINIAIRPWTNVADFGPAAPEIYQAIIHEFRASKIEIPFPHRDVRLLGESKM
jgi:small conductance mechanosensitive channel